MPQRNFVAGALFFFLFAQDAIRKRGAEYDATCTQAQALPQVFVAPASCRQFFHNEGKSAGPSKMPPPFKIR
jgi:hypothetical protein